MSKRVKIILIVIVLLVVVYIIWLLGATAKEKQATTTQVYYDQLLMEDARLKDLVNTNLRIKGLLLEVPEATSSPAFTAKQLNLIEPQNELIIREYGQKISQILKPYGKPRDNEVLLVLNSLKGSDPNTLSKLEQIKTLHKKAIDELLVLNVPKDAQVVHLKLINSLSRLAENLGYMSQILEEPKIALKASDDYLKNMVLFFQAIEGVNIYFSKQGIIFGEDENINIYDSIGLVQQN